MRWTGVVAAVALLALASMTTGSLVHKTAVRTIDVSTSVVRMTQEVEITNTGSSSVSTYAMAIPAGHAPFLAFVDAFTPNDDVLPVTTSTSTPSDAPTGTKMFEVALEAPLGKGKSVKLTVVAVFVGALKPFPKEIAQAERQFMLYFGNHYVYSPYVTKKQRTVVKLASSNVVSHTTQEPTSLSGASLTYGPYADVAPFTVSEMKVHYENNAPFVTATSMVKEFEVSHWGGNLAVEESYKLEHTGAKLKGSFSRYDYQRNPAAAGIASVRSVTAILPADAADVYYRDVIGNISTSALRSLREQVEVEMRPRFPLFGGWKTEFYMGYNLPLAAYLRVAADSGRYILTVDMAGAFENVPVTDAIIRLVLPEGASDVAVHTPFAVEPELSISSRKTYLDTSGRVVAEFSAANLVTDQDLVFQVSYALSATAILMEPILLMSALFALFLAAMVYVRLDLSLSPSLGGIASETSTFVADIARATSALAKLDNALAAWAHSSDSKTFAAAKKNLDREFRTPSAGPRTLPPTPPLEARRKLFTKLDTAQAEFFSSTISADALASRSTELSTEYFGLATQIEQALDALH
ncbi:ribophorin I [Thecamonas trahens ATCC 50062]|uniref:Dolichyl-diphosphooligosaccharide--protein glycosyltransferase subunit 1 n=1 Tax=Thecamonas trahens ATCC 50062 TaxID=461836 RepID=A0A0L0DCA5_THETB|nr:ribophorin I [Thecamonas trahens ATCC 50062]KNC49974.1 ribophorin I [Thecamonas trahens ATCC 50062]|eukprot:XP_013757144.1 ribophorin I [Thecamonas trahens ATCC 50062]